MGNLAQALVESAKVHGDRPAIRQDDVVLTYAQLDDASSRVAAMLRRYGVRPGDRVGVMLPNVVSFPVVYYGVLRAGGVVVPMFLLPTLVFLEWMPGREPPMPGWKQCW